MAWHTETAEIIGVQNGVCQRDGYNVDGMVDHIQLDSSDSVMFAAMSAARASPRRTSSLDAI